MLMLEPRRRLDVDLTFVALRLPAHVLLIAVIVFIVVFIVVFFVFFIVV